MKKLTTLALFGSLTLIGCADETKYQTQGRQPQRTAVDSTRYSFDSFGMKSISEYNNEISAMASGDFDGDGDTDIAIAINSGSKIFIYENKMPQKGNQ